MASRVFQGVTTWEACMIQNSKIFGPFFFDVDSIKGQTMLKMTIANRLTFSKVITIASLDRSHMKGKT